MSSIQQLRFISGQKRPVPRTRRPGAPSVLIRGWCYRVRSRRLRPNTITPARAMPAPMMTSSDVSTPVSQHGSIRVTSTVTNAPSPSDAALPLRFQLLRCWSRCHLLPGRPPSRNRRSDQSGAASRSGNGLISAGRSRSSLTKRVASSVQGDKCPVRPPPISFKVWS